MGASEENDVEKVAARLEREADDLERRSKEAGDQIEFAREEWHRKRNDSSVPGAVPEDPEEDTDRRQEH
jgi:hypothetical protein